MHDAMNFKIKYLDENIEILEYFLTLPLSPQVRRATQAKIENLKGKRMQRIKYLERWHQKLKKGGPPKSMFGRWNVSGAQFLK